MLLSFFFFKHKQKVKKKHKYNKTDLKVLSCVGSSALLPLLSRDNGLGGVQHQVLQLQSFHEVRVPHDTWKREGSLYCMRVEEPGIVIVRTTRSTARVPLSKVLMSSIVW